MENKAVKSVDAISGLQYQEILNQRGFINNHRWELMSRQRAHILKCAFDPKTQAPIEGMLPSWVFVEELLGVKLNIPAMGIVGDYDYNTQLSVLQNIHLLAGQVKPEELAKSKILTEEQKSNLSDSINTSYEEWKRDFIHKRTSVFVVTYDQIASNFQKFRTGILDKTMSQEERVEAVKKLRNLYRLIGATMEEKFVSENPDVSKLSIDEAAKRLGNYKYKNSPVNTPLKTIAQTYVVYSNLAMESSGRLIEVEFNNTPPRTLAAFKLNEDKMKGILAAEKSSDNPQFDIISVELFYDNATQKMLAGGKDLKINSTDVIIPEENVFELFQAAIPVGSFMKCYGMNIYPVSEFESESIRWLVNNKRYVDSINNEKREKIDDRIFALINAESAVAAQEGEAEEFLDNLEFKQDSELDGLLSNTTAQTPEKPIMAETPIVPEADMSSVEALIPEDVKAEEAVEETATEEEDLEAIAKKYNVTVEQYKVLRDQGLFK